MVYQTLPYNLDTLQQRYKTDLKVNNPEKEIERLFKMAAFENTQKITSRIDLVAAFVTLAMAASLVGVLMTPNPLVPALCALVTGLLAVDLSLAKGHLENNPRVFVRQFKNGKVDSQARGSRIVFQKAEEYLVQEYRIVRKDPFMPKPIPKGMTM
jgi:hypothetical protein